MFYTSYALLYSMHDFIATLEKFSFNRGEGLCEINLIDVLAQRGT